MNREEFNKLVEELLTASIKTLNKKSKEYATEDVLANFRQPTSMLGVSAAEVCLMYQMKHIASLVKIAREGASKEMLLEKCQDTLNYVLFFYALMSESK